MDLGEGCFGGFVWDFGGLWRGLCGLRGFWGFLGFCFLGEKGGGCFPFVFFFVFGVEFVLFSVKNCLCGDDVFFL